jgi:hypothetical protein
MGMQIVGPKRAEHAVLQIAKAYEEATAWIRKVLPPLLRSQVEANVHPAIVQFKPMMHQKP